MALSETAVYDPELRAIQEEMVGRQAEPLARLIRDGRGSGDVRDVPIRETVIALVGMVQLACERLAGEGAQGQERLAEAITSIAWHALFPDDAGGEAA